MKLLAFGCALALVAAMSASSLAGSNLNSSKSNIYKIDGTTMTEADCAKKGGTVSTDKDGNKICTLPQGAETTTVKGSKSNSDN